MKAIFAVTALAAAISAQALAADTESTTEFSGAIDLNFVYNMDPNDAVADMEFVQDGDDGEGTEFDMTVKVVNGPFSGGVEISGGDDERGLNDQSFAPQLKVELADMVITEGKLSFGQVGSFDATDEYIDASVTMNDNDVDVEDIEDDIAFRYQATDEFAVQLGSMSRVPSVSDTPEDDGLLIASAQYKAEAGALSYVGEVQYGVLTGKNTSYASTGSAPIGSGSGVIDDLDNPYYVGLGATYTADMYTVAAALNYVGNTAGDTAMEYAIDVSTEFAGVKLGAGYIEPNSEVKDADIIDVNAKYTIDAYSVSAEYLYTVLEDAGDELSFGVAWAQNAYTASADFTLGDFDADDADDLLTELEATYTSEAGVTYYANYNLQKDKVNNVKLGGKYAF